MSEGKADMSDALALLDPLVSQSQSIAKEAKLRTRVANGAPLTRLANLLGKLPPRCKNPTARGRGKGTGKGKGTQAVARAQWCSPLCRPATRPWAR